MPLDRALLAQLASLVDDATAAFDGYDYARALDRTERFFWGFCDDYVELVKQRAYGGAGEGGAVSARAALALALHTLLRLFAPHLPYVTEEVWSWWQEGSIHRESWPVSERLRDTAGDVDPAVYDIAAQVLGEIRKAKTSAQRSMRSEVTSVVVTDEPGRLDALRGALDDVREAGRVEELVCAPGDAFSAAVTLADAAPAAPREP
jgi:valyl-tRNA synthetase